MIVSASQSVCRVEYYGELRTECNVNYIIHMLRVMRSQMCVIGLYFHIALLRTSYTNAVCSQPRRQASEFVTEFFALPNAFQLVAVKTTSFYYVHIHIYIYILQRAHCDDCYRHIAASHPAPHRLVQLYRCSTSYSVCNCRCDKMATTMPYGVLRTGGDVLGYIGAGVRGRVSMVMAMRMA